MEYQYLDVDQRRAVLEARLRQLENEHFGHALNKAHAEGNEKKAEADEAMAIIDTAYETTKSELDALEPAATPASTPKKTKRTEPKVT